MGRTEEGCDPRVPDPFSLVNQVYVPRSLLSRRDLSSASLRKEIETPFSLRDSIAVSSIQGPAMGRDARF